jgi:hypothetical protein
MSGCDGTRHELPSGASPRANVVRSTTEQAEYSAVKYYLFKTALVSALLVHLAASSPGAQARRIGPAPLPEWQDPGCGQQAARLRGEVGGGID